MSGRLRGFKCLSDEKSDSTPAQVMKSQTSTFNCCQNMVRYDENMTRMRIQEFSGEPSRALYITSEDAYEENGLEGKSG
jgi:hypothetical protein